MQEERLIRTNPPYARTDLGGAPQLSRTAGGCGEGGSGCVAGHETSPRAAEATGVSGAPQLCWARL